MGDVRLHTYEESIAAAEDGLYHVSMIRTYALGSSSWAASVVIIEIWY
jgi:hypothetical protein